MDSARVNNGFIGGFKSLESMVGGCQNNISLHQKSQIVIPLRKRELKEVRKLGEGPRTTRDESLQPPPLKRTTKSISIDFKSLLKDLEGPKVAQKGVS